MAVHGVCQDSCRELIIKKITMKAFFAQLE